MWQWQELAARAAYRAGADPGEGGKGDQPGHHLQDRRLQCLNGGDHYRRDRWQRVRSLKGSEEERGKIRCKRKKDEILRDPCDYTLVFRNNSYVKLISQICDWISSYFFSFILKLQAFNWRQAKPDFFCPSWYKVVLLRENYIL